MVTGTHYLPTSVVFLDDLTIRNDASTGFSIASPSITPGSEAFRNLVFDGSGDTIVSAELNHALGNFLLTGALLDRLTHRVHILEANGESYRLQDAKRRRKPKKK